MKSLEESDLFEIGHEWNEQDTTTISEDSRSFHQEFDMVPLLKTILASSNNGDDDDDVVIMDIYEKTLTCLREFEGDDYKKCNFKKRKILMELRKYGFDASLCRSSWISTKDYPGGEYEYIDINILKDSINGTTSTTRLIVDIDFKSQFEIARPTKAYTNLLIALPSVFVGGGEKLKKVIDLLCTATSRSFTENGLHLPPWRKASYMKSKWLCSGNKPFVIPMSNAFDRKKVFD